MSLYEILGVERDAGQAAIKHAYRKLAAKWHPDREGGDTERFQEIERAYSILKDPKRRAHYDETGDAIADVAVEGLAKGLLMEVLDALLRKDVPPGQLISACVKVVRSQKSETAIKVGKAGAASRNLQELCDSVAHNGDGENFFATALQNRIEQQEADRAMLSKNLKACDRALEILEEYDDIGAMVTFVGGTVSSTTTGFSTY